MTRLTSEADIKALVLGDQDMMRALGIARDLNLPDWWIGAGFLRNKVWDVQSGVQKGPATDVDLVYFDTSDVTPERDWQYDEQLHKVDPKNNWEVRNQARMHYVNGHDQFSSTRDGIAHWTETATAIGVKLDADGKLKFLFCYGLDDLLDIVARPTPFMKGDLLEVFASRMQKKNWQKRWPKLKVENQ
jgi:hypothetical protein